MSEQGKTERWVIVSKFKPLFTESTYEQALCSPRCGVETESDVFRLLTKPESDAMKERETKLKALLGDSVMVMTQHWPTKKLCDKILEFLQENSHV